MGKKVVEKITFILRDKGGLRLFLFYRLKYSVAKIMGVVLSDESYASWLHSIYTGKKLNVRNPAYYDEKIWWLKFNNRDPLLTICADKNAVRNYVKEKGFSDILIPQVALYDSVREIEFAKFENEVIIKCTHNSGGHLFYNPLKPLDKSKFRIGIKQLNLLLQQNSSVLSREWCYKNIKPQLTVEEVIRDKNGALPLDYKFMCFDGEPKLLFLDFGVINADNYYYGYYPRNIYDMDFNLLPLPILENRPNADFPVEKPVGFEYMVKIARELSAPFPHCRVDLYNIDGKVYFGEITFYHGAGCNNIKPEEWDLRLGEWININSNKIVLKKDMKVQ